MTQILIYRQTVIVYTSKVTNDKVSVMKECSCLMFKQSSSYNHTSSVSLTLSNDFVNDALTQLILFVHKAFSQCKEVDENI